MVARSPTCSPHGGELLEELLDEELLDELLDEELLELELLELLDELSQSKRFTMAGHFCASCSSNGIFMY